jgi:hypothetical protein
MELHRSLFPFAVIRVLSQELASEMLGPREPGEVRV